MKLVFIVVTLILAVKVNGINSQLKWKVKPDTDHDDLDHHEWLLVDYNLSFSKQIQDDKGNSDDDERNQPKLSPVASHRSENYYKGICSSTPEDSPGAGVNCDNMNVASITVAYISGVVFCAISAAVFLFCILFLPTVYPICKYLRLWNASRRLRNGTVCDKGKSCKTRKSRNNLTVT